MFDDADIIFKYTRKQAIEDGVLVDVSEMAKEAGFTYPAAVTRRVWDEVVTPPDGSRELGQSEVSRLWDVLWMLYCAIQCKFPQETYADGSTELRYSLYVLDADESHRLVTLKSLCHGGDNGEPVITIMFPDED